MSAKSSDDNDDVALVKSKEYSDDSHGPSNSTNTTTRFSLTRSSAPRRGPQPGVLIEIPKTTVSEAPLRVYKKKNRSQSFHPSTSPDFYRQGSLAIRSPFRHNYNKRVTSEVPPKQRQLPNQDISSERSLRLRNISKSPPRNPKSGAKVPDIIEVGDDSPKRFKLSHDAGSELLRPKTSRGRIEDDIFPKSSRTFSSNNVLSVENRETETVNKSEYFSAEESDDPILEVTGKGRGKAEEHTMSRTLYTSQLRSQPLPVHHTYTKGTGANVIASRGEDVNRYQSEDPYSDEDRERHRDLDRGRYPSIVESPPLSHNSPPSNLREQSNNKDILECWLEHLSIGKRTYRHSEYRLKVVVKNKLYSLYIQDLNDGGSIKYDFRNTDFKSFMFYVGPPHPTGFMWSFKATANITDLERDYTPDALEPQRRFIIGIVSQNKRAFQTLVSQVLIKGKCADPIDENQWISHLKIYGIRELEESLSFRETQRHSEKSSLFESNETPATSSKQVDTITRTYSTRHKKSRSPSPQHREMRLLRTSPLLLDRTLFVYPFKGVGAVTMTDDDVSRLSDGEFLNDNIIEFYLKWYFDQLKEKNPSLADKVHIFNSFFYKRLTQKAKSNKNEDSYDRVKKWTAKVDLFSKQYIFMPVNESLHWYLVLICNHDLMLPQNSRKNPIDLDAEVTIPPITTTDPLNSQTILADKDLVMEQATVRRSPSSRNMHRVPTDDLIQKISASKSETGSNECGEIIIGKAPVAPVDCEPENDKVSQINGYNLKDSNTLRIEPDDMDIDTSSSPRVVSCETPEVVIFSPPKSKKRVNGNPAHKPPHIVIEDSQPDEQGERHQPRISTRGRTLITNKSGPIVVKASLSPEPKRPRFDEDDVKFPTLEDVGKKTKRSVSPPLTSGLKKGKDKEKEFVDPNRGPWIIILDSLGSKHPTVSKTIKKYLTSEAKEKRKVDVNLEMLTCIYAKVPKQTNHCDCGVYLLHYVEKFLGDPEKYLQLLVNKEDNKQAWSPSEIHSKREYIRNVIHTTADIYQIEMVKEKSLQEK